MNDDKIRWFDRFLDLLAASIRPKHTDRRFRDACQIAYSNGWTPEQLAQMLNAHNYQGAVNPPAVLIVQLERVGERPPLPSGPMAKRYGCSQCTHGWIDLPDTQPDQSWSPWKNNRRSPRPPARRGVGPSQQTAPCPTCRPETASRVQSMPPPGTRNPVITDPALLDERWQLIRELMARHDLSEDEREQAMTTLIREQNRRAGPAWSTSG